MRKPGTLQVKKIGQLTNTRDQLSHQTDFHVDVDVDVDLGHHVGHHVHLHVSHLSNFMSASFFLLLFVGHHLGRLVGYLVRLHVGHHNVVSMLCEGSEKSESMTNGRTFGRTDRGRC